MPGQNLRNKLEKTAEVADVLLNVCCTRTASEIAPGGKMKPKRLGYIVLGIFVIWFLVGYLATMPVVGNHPFWRQMRAQPRDFGLKAEDEYFPSDDGILLHAWYIPAEGASRGTLILAHGIDGNASDMLPRAWFLARDHYDSLVIDLRAHGRSAGNYATPGYMEARDILGSLSYLRHGRHDGGPIAVFGHSYGAVAGLYAAAKTPDIAAVIADGAFISFEKMMRRATILLSQDPDRSYFDRLGLEVAGTRAAEWAVLPIYFLRTQVWPARTGPICCRQFQVSILGLSYSSQGRKTKSVHQKMPGLCMKLQTVPTRFYSLCRALNTTKPMRRRRSCMRKPS